MAGDFVPEEELNLKGFQKYFNTYTLRGRFNCVVATYATVFAMVLLYQLNKRNKRNLPNSKVAGSKSPEVSPKCQKKIPTACK